MRGWRLEIKRKIGRYLMSLPPNPCDVRILSTPEILIDKLVVLHIGIGITSSGSRVNDKARAHKGQVRAQAAGVVNNCLPPDGAAGRGVHADDRGKAVRVPERLTREL